MRIFRLHSDRNCSLTERKRTPLLPSLFPSPSLSASAEHFVYYGECDCRLPIVYSPFRGTIKASILSIDQLARFSRGEHLSAAACKVTLDCEFAKCLSLSFS